MKLKGKVSIIRKGDVMSIEIEDANSSTQFVTADLTLADFARAISGQGFLNAELAIRGLDRLGKERQTKHVEVAVPDSTAKRTAATIRMAVAQYEADGWKGNDGDCSNSHRRLRTEGDCLIYKVLYVSYV